MASKKGANKDNLNDNKQISCTQDISQYNAKQSLLNYNIIVGHKLSKTKQGSIYSGTCVGFGNTPIKIVIKRADKGLYKRKKHKFMNEDIMKESDIISHIMRLNPPNGFLKKYYFIDDGFNYFLIINDAGTSLLNDAQYYHSLIKTKKFNINEWKNHVKILFKQLVNMVYFLHNKARVCHMDIGLENLLIKGCEYKNNKFTQHGQICLSGFDLAEYFDETNTNFMCTKYVGKISYQAPEVYSKKPYFDARKKDIWSIGVSLFMLQFGVKPYNVPSNQDILYRNIMNGYLHRMIIDNEMSNCCSNWFLDIISNIFKKPYNRWNSIKLLKCLSN